MKGAAGALDEALTSAVEVKGVRLVTLRADGLERGQLRTLVDNLKQRLGEGVVVLGSAQPEGKVALIAGVTPGLTKRIQAGKLVGAVAKLVGGSGGRRDCRRVDEISNCGAARKNWRRGFPPFRRKRGRIEHGALWRIRNAKSIKNCSY